MPETTILFYRERDAVPVLDWLLEQSTDAQERCHAMLLRLAEHGHELRRPHCDYLGDGVFELRARLGRVNYRILYFFFGQNVVGLAAGLTKEEEVPDQDIQRAVQRRRRLEGDPAPYVCEVEL